MIDIPSLDTTGNAAFGSSAVICLLTGALSFGGGMVSIGFMRYLSVKAGFDGFSYYSFGLALFSFILYLTI